MKREIDELRKRAKTYSTAKTFSYVKEAINGRENFYNGFVVKVFEDMIIFFDIVLKKEFPILFESLIVIEPSKKDMSIKTAWDIYGGEK